MLSANFEPTPVGTTGVTRGMKSHHKFGAGMCLNNSGVIHYLGARLYKLSVLMALATMFRGLGGQTNFSRP